MEEPEHLNSYVIVIQTYIYARIVLGLYYDITLNRCFRFLLKMYCVFIAVILIFFRRDLLRGFANSLMRLIEIAEFIACVLFSMFYKKQFSFLKRIPLVDDSVTATKRNKDFRKLIFFLWFPKVIFVSFTFFWNLFFRLNEFDTVFMVCIRIMIPISLIISRSRFVIICIILYIRVKNLRLTLESLQATETHHPRLKLRRVMEMYMAIESSFHEQIGSFSCSVVIYLINIMWTQLYFIGVFLSLLKENNLNFLISSRLIVSLWDENVEFILISVLFDLIATEQQRLQEFLVERKIAANSEKEREECWLFLILLKNIPIKYTVFRIMSISMKTMLTVFSFICTTTIAIMQVRRIDYAAVHEKDSV